MADLEVRTATREDAIALMGSCPHTMKAFVGVLDGKPIAIGGLSYQRGRVVAFCNLSDDMRKRPVALHKAARAVMRAALDSGHRYIFAERDPDEPTAARWLERLGFRPVDSDGMVHLWQH